MLFERFRSFRGGFLPIALLGFLIAVAGIVMSWEEYTLEMAPEPAPTPASRGTTAPVPHFRTQVERGEYLFRTLGCPRCHGEAGRGGVPNANYARDNVPQLNELADQIGLMDNAQKQAFVGVIEHGQDPLHLTGPPPFEGWERVAPRFGDVVATIQNGSVPAKQDPNGPPPPLQMPAWRPRLHPDEIRAIVAYLITLDDLDA